MIEQRVTLRYDAQQIPAIVQAVQGDTGRDVIFELADYEIPSGATANYYIDKPDGNAIYNSAEVLSSTEILAHLTEQALAAPGRNNGQVRILSDDEVITSFDFVLEVEAFRGILRLQSETEVNIFDEALQAAAEDAIQEILDQTPVVTGMQNSIAQSYSNSQTYNVGDYVMYNAQLYKCNTPITTAEVWTPAHWTQIPIAEDVKDLRYAFSNLNYWTSRFNVAPGVSHSSRKDMLYVNVKAGEKVIINHVISGTENSPWFQLIAIYDDGTSEVIQTAYGNNRNKVVTASKDTVSFGLYFTSSNAEGFTVDFSAYKLLSSAYRQYDNFFAYIVNQAGIDVVFNNGNPVYNIKNSINICYNGNMITKSKSSMLSELSTVATDDGKNGIYLSINSGETLVYSLSNGGVLRVRDRTLLYPEDYPLLISNYNGICGGYLQWACNILDGTEGIINRSIFSVEDNASHSSTSDICKVDIKAGNIYSVYIKADNTEARYSQIKAKYSDGSTEDIDETSIGLSYYKKFVANKDIKSIGIYVASGYKAYTMAVDVVNIPVLDDKIANIHTIATVQGSRGNQSNNYVVYSGLYPVAERKIRIHTDRPLSSVSNHYGFGLCQYIDSPFGNIRRESAKETAVGRWADGENIYLLKDTVAVGITVAEYDASNALIPEGITAESFNGYHIWIEEIPEEYNDITALSDKENTFAGHFLTGEDVETFLFFTDPHLYPHYDFNEYESRCALASIKHVYDETPTSFVLCGGDWLTNNDTQVQAAKSLGLIDGITREFFGDKYYPINGNHDTNYQGSGSPSELPLSTQKNLMFRNYKNTYYDFKGSMTRFYVFDSGIDWDGSMDSFRWNQVDWFANSLSENDDRYSVIAIHIFTNQEKTDLEELPDPQPLADNLTLIAKAYNSKTSISLNGNTYDFSNTSGKVSFLIAGHTHYDAVGTYNDIPFMITTNCTYNPRFDLIYIDYDSAKLKTVRIGDGSDREMGIIV